MKHSQWFWLLLVMVGVYSLFTFVKCGESTSFEETLFPYDPSEVESVAELYELAIDAESIADIFGVELQQPIGKEEMQSFLRDQVGIVPMDAGLAANGFPRWGSRSFIPDPVKQAALAAEGLTEAEVEDGLTPREYLTYLRVVHGEGRCDGAAAGSIECPAKVRDFQLHLVVLENPIWNIRSAATKDEQYENKFSIHRENYANRLSFDFIGMALGLGDNPLKKVILDDRCDLLRAFLASEESFHEFLVERVGVHADVATVIANQYVGIEEMYDGTLYQYGMRSFYQGDVCCRYPAGEGNCYEEDMVIYDRILELHPEFVPATDLSCAEIKDMLNVIASYPASISDPADLFSPPFDEQSPHLTGDELVDFTIGFGNALTNMPNAPFADIIPEADLERLNECGVYNAENQLTGKTLNYFYELLLNDVPLR